MTTKISTWLPDTGYVDVHVSNEGLEHENTNQCMVFEKENNIP